MQVIENEVVSGKTIAIDEKNFVNCHYKNCMLVYTGGEFSFANTQFENCQLNFAGAAQRTASLLGNFGIIEPGSHVAPKGTEGPKGPKVLKN